MGLVYGGKEKGKLQGYQPILFDALFTVDPVKIIQLTTHFNHLNYILP
jgi:hypothetical protein